MANRIVVIEEDAEALLAILRAVSPSPAILTLAVEGLRSLQAKSGACYDDILYWTQRLWCAREPAERLGCQKDLDAQVRLWLSISALVVKGLPLGESWLLGRLDESVAAAAKLKGRTAAASVSRALRTYSMKVSAPKEADTPTTEHALASQVKVTAESMDGGRLLITATVGSQSAKTWLVRKDWPRKGVDQSKMAARVAILLGSNLPALLAPAVGGGELIRQAILNSIKPAKTTPGMAA